MPLRNPYALDTPVSPHAKFRPRRPLDTPIAPTPPYRYGWSARQDFKRAGLKGVMQGLGQVGIEAVKPYADIWREASKPFLPGPLGQYVSGEAFTPQYKQYKQDAQSAMAKLAATHGQRYIPKADVPAAMKQANLTPFEMAAAQRQQDELDRTGLAAARATGVTEQMTLRDLMEIAQARGEFLLQRGQDDPIQPTGLHSASVVSEAHPTLGPHMPQGWLHFVPGSRVPFANWLDSWTSMKQLGTGEEIDPWNQVMGAPGRVIQFQPQAWKQELLGAQNSWATADYLDHIVASNTYIPTEPELRAHSNLSTLLDRAGALQYEMNSGKAWGESAYDVKSAIKELLHTIMSMQDSGAIGQVDIPDWDDPGIDDLKYLGHPSMEAFLDELYDGLEGARRNLSQFWKPPPPVGNVGVRTLAATPLEESPYGPYLARGQAPVHPYNEVIANYGMPRIPAGWPPGYEVRRMPEGSLSYTTHVLIMPGGGEGLPVSLPIPNEDVSGISLEQYRLNTWQEYLYENPGALSVPSTQRVAGVYGPPWGEDPEEGPWSFGPLAGIGHPPGTPWREIAEELGVPYIETGK